MTRASIIVWAAFVFLAGGWVGFASGQAMRQATAVRVVDDGCLGVGAVPWAMPRNGLRASR